MKSLNFRYRDTLSAFGSYDGVVAGRGACLLLLWLLSEEPDGCICIRDARRRYPGLAQTFDWLEAGHLARSFEEIRGLAGFLFYNERAGVLSVEDPQLEFYLRNLGWVDFAKRNGHSVRIHPKRGLIFEEPE